MSTVLVIDDAALDRKFVGQLLEEEVDLDVVSMADG